MIQRLFALTIVTVWLAACGGPGPSNGVMPQSPADTSMSPSKVNPPFPEPPDVLPVHHVATVSLTAKVNPANELPAFVYNGQTGVAPTIRVKPGDTIVIDVLNSLPGPGRLGDLNLHFHGLGVSPNPPADDVITTLALPGGSLHYVVPIPKNQEPGLYWYHPHVFPNTNFQVGDSGMSGAIVVEGLERHLPGLAKMKERLMMVRDIGTGDSDSRRALPHGISNVPCGPDPGLTVTVNGAVRPVIPIAPGEQQFFRVVNATGHKNLKLAVDGGTLQIVAIDGFALDSYPGTGPTETVPSVVVPPAARAEFVVTGPAGTGAKFRTLCYNSGPGGDPDPQAVLAVLQAPQSGPDRRAVGSHRLRAGAPLPNNAYSFPLPAPVGQRTVTLSEDDKRMYINGKSFKMMDPPMFVVNVGTTEKWQIVNVTQEVHDFHIHQTHFVVKEIDGVKVAHPYWADSVVVPHEKNGTPGTVTLLMDFRDPVIRGTFMFHCHILDHEDSGMMAKIQAI
ncbi:MAG TPA: multicopper oxidase family protein [Candidatus Tumulicola sp.]